METLLSIYLVVLGLLQLALSIWAVYKKRTRYSFRYKDDVLHWQVLFFIWPITLVLLWVVAIIISLGRAIGAIFDL